MLSRCWKLQEIEFIVPFPGHGLRPLIGQLRVQLSATHTSFPVSLDFALSLSALSRSAWHRPCRLLCSLCGLAVSLFFNLATFIFSDCLLPLSLQFCCFDTEGVMAGDELLETSTRQACRKQELHAPKKQPKLPQAPIAGCSTMPADPTHSRSPSTSSALLSNATVCGSQPRCKSITLA